LKDVKERLFGAIGDRPRCIGRGREQLAAAKFTGDDAHGKSLFPFSIFHLPFSIELMADRTIHYEAAFEAFLRERGIPYVAVDEAKKALFANAKLKSFDFVVYSKNGPNLLIDVKGRQCRDRAGGRKSFETWTTQRDVEDLMQWEQVFGDGFKAVLTFVYWIDAPLTP